MRSAQTITNSEESKVPSTQSDARTSTASKSLFLAFLAALLCGLVLAISAAQAAAPPLITKTSFSAVTETSVTLRVLVDPQSAKVQHASFQYISFADYEADGGSFGAGTKSTADGEVPISVKGRGDLTANSNTVTNLTTSAGAFAVGQTISSAGIPAETTISAIEVGPGGTQLILSHGAAATAAGVQLTASGPQPFSARISGLSPVTAYVFRFLAENRQGAVTGPEVTLSTLSPTPTYGPCPNDALRSGEYAPFGHPAALLPDCRSYEQASPVNKDGGDIQGERALVKASPEGDTVSFGSTFGLPGGEGAQALPTYLASRGAGDWSTRGLLPPPSAGERAWVMGWSPVIASSQRLR